MNIENAEFPLMDTSPSLQTSSDILAKTTPPAQHFTDANSIWDELRKCSADIKAKKKSIQHLQVMMASGTENPELKVLATLEKTLHQQLEDLQKRGVTLELVL
ncbi:hypothetical protein HNY73_014255 [Argiope bruennichi]|uniref:Uncharacterized protein n=1 Tax=Argiope bruennichi TaxID=94029 RepID=A0A8T0ENP8_ARGBR|nr:hypothetical protein HNY73_014255 [Argiope bruennichi]